MHNKFVKAFYFDADKHAYPHFRGRSSEIGVLIRHLFNENYAKPFIQVITGLNGIGKTALISRFVHQFFSAYRLIQWFDSKNIEKAFRDLAHSLELFNVKIKNINQLSNTELIERVKTELKKFNGWLLIFDDIETYEQISKYLPKFDTDKLQHIIITSPFASWLEANHTLALSNLSEEESLQIFESWSREKSRNEKLEDIANWKKLAYLLNYLPLALTQACCYILNHHISVSTYLKIFNSEKRRFWFFESPTPKSSSTIKNVWNPTIEIISKSEIAKNILNCFAVSNSDPLSVTILYQLPYKKEEIVNAIKLLVDYFFIAKTPMFEDFFIPSLLKTFIKVTLTSEETKTWQIKLKNLERLSLKEYTLNKVVKYLNEEDPILLSKFSHLTIELQDSLLFKIPTLSSTLKNLVT